ncbi:MAG: hypothetical protein ACOC1K_05645, partial [Nanoarchaeota archaeon]
DILPEVEICGINISAGYYMPHRKNEYVILSELQNSIDFVIDICNNVNEKFDLPMQYIDSRYIEDDFIDDDLYLGLDIAEDLKNIKSINELNDYVYSKYPDNIMLLDLINKAYDLGKYECEREIEKYDFGL